MTKAENEFQPDYISPPGDLLFEILESLGMTQAELASRMGRPKKTINEIIQGKTAITPDTALQLERSLGTPASFWLSRESQYQEALARIQDTEQLQLQEARIDEFPLREMCRRNWIPQRGNKTDQLREILSFFGVAGTKQFEAVWNDALNSTRYRQSAARPANWAAVAAWLRKGEIDAQAIDCQPHNAETFRHVLMVARSLTTSPIEDSWPQVVKQCAEAGVAAVIVPELPDTRLSGASRWISPRKAILQLSIRYRKDDQFWFSFFHEAGHLLLHNKSTLFLRIDDGRPDIGQEEEEANRFAADFLIPRTDLNRFLVKRPTSKPFSKTEVIAFAQELGVAPGIVVGRLQHDRRLPQKNLNGLKLTLQWDEFGQVMTR